MRVASGELLEKVLEVVVRLRDRDGGGGPEVVEKHHGGRDGGRRGLPVLCGLHAGLWVRTASIILNRATGESQQSSRAKVSDTAPQTPASLRTKVGDTTQLYN